MKNRFFYGWVVVAACFLTTAISYGTAQYAFGVFFKPMLAEFGWPRAMTSGAFSTYMIVHGLSAIIMGGLTDRYGPRVTIGIGGFLIGLGLFSTSRIDAIWQLYASYGILLGMGMGAAYAPVLSVVSRWFTKKRGLVLGIVTAGVGAGGLIMPPLAQYLISSYGWRASYFIIAGIAWTVIIPSALLLRRDPGEMGTSPYGEAEIAEEVDPMKTSTAGRKDLPLPEAIRTVPFWMLFAIFGCSILSVQMIMVHIVAHATDVGISAVTAANILGMVGGSSIIGRIGMGRIADSIGAKRALLVCLAIETMAMFWLIIIEDAWSFYAFAAVFGFAYGGCQPQFPALSGSFFGLDYMGAIFGMVLLGATIGGAVGPAMGGWVFDTTSSYRIAIEVGAVTALTALVLASILKTPTRAGYKYHEGEKK